MDSMVDLVDYRCWGSCRQLPLAASHQPFPFPSDFAENFPSGIGGVISQISVSHSDIETQAARFRA